MDGWISMYMNVWISGCMNVWVCRCMICMDVGIYTVYMYEFLEARIVDVDV